MFLEGIFRGFTGSLKFKVALQICMEKGGGGLDQSVGRMIGVMINTDIMVIFLIEIRDFVYAKSECTCTFFNVCAKTTILKQAHMYACFCCSFAQPKFF
jgi:hypothetical protein